MYVIVILYSSTAQFNKFHACPYHNFALADEPVLFKVCYLTILFDTNTDKLASVDVEPISLPYRLP